MIDSGFWQNRKVFVTGHTGFKGSWLCLWLHYLKAEVTGYALDPPTNPSLFKLCHIESIVKSVIADVRDGEVLHKAMSEAGPEIVIHMAAQPLVRESYRRPADTFATNVMGTVNLFEAVRRCGSVRAVINVTSDKCYENKEWIWGYRENDTLGGYDPYSSSKACAELVTSSYRNSFFNLPHNTDRTVGIASVRAGNVIGGGDWAPDRLVPDCIRALLHGEEINVRYPDSVRPWQHVLEPLCGYLMLAQKLCEEKAVYSGAWNFGPDEHDVKTVEWIVNRICKKWEGAAVYKKQAGDHPYEAHCLKLDCSKAKEKLGWYPLWDLEAAIDRVMEWALAYRGNRDVADVCLKQIKEYSGTGNAT